MDLIPSEQRRRHAYIEKSIKSYADLLDTAESLKAPIGTAISDHRYVLNHLTIPNLRHDVLKIGRQALKDDEFIPIWAMKLGETVHFGNWARSPHPQQRLRQLDFLEQRSPKDANSYERILRHGIIDERKKDISVKRRSLAAVEKNHSAIVTNSKWIDKSPLTLFSLRPTMLLNNSYGSSRAVPDVLGHETEHVVQLLTDYAIQQCNTYGSIVDDHIREELGAYAVQAALMGVMIDTDFKFKNGERPSYSTYDGAAGIYHFSYVFDINNFRKQVNAQREDSFFPDKKIREMFISMGISMPGAHLSDEERGEPIPDLNS